MAYDLIQDIAVTELLSTNAGRKLRQIIETIEGVQKGLYQLAVNEDSAGLDLLKIGTVFQIFFIDVLASGKKPADLTEKDWQGIADKVYKYAVMEDGQKYSEFVFTLYADYIDISVKVLPGSRAKENAASIRKLSAEIRKNTENLRKEKIVEAAYIETCLWLSLEAMIKLLACYFTGGIAQEYADLALSVSQLAFEYGRFVLYAREQAILDQYLQNQQVLDEQLQKEYEEYLEEVRVQSEAFRKLVEGAFDSDIQDALHNTAALARAAGVKEEEILKTTEDVDAFFLD